MGSIYDVFQVTYTGSVLFEVDVDTLGETLENVVIPGVYQSDCLNVSHCVSPRGSKTDLELEDTYLQLGFGSVERVKHTLRLWGDPWQRSIDAENQLRNWRRRQPSGSVSMPETLDTRDAPWLLERRLRHVVHATGLQRDVVLRRVHAICAWLDAFAVRDGEYLPDDVEHQYRHELCIPGTPCIARSDRREAWLKDPRKVWDLYLHPHGTSR